MSELSKFGSSRAASLLMLGVLASAPVCAGPIAYYLDQSNQLADGRNYLQVTLAAADDGSIDFTVQVLQPLLDLAGENFGIDKFAFNVVGGMDTNARNVSDLPGDWTARDSGRMDGFGLFDIKLKGRGDSRTDLLTFAITGIDLDTLASYIDLSTGRSPEGHVFFAAHVGGFDTCGAPSPSRVGPATFSGGSGEHAGGDWGGGDHGEGGGSEHGDGDHGGGGDSGEGGGDDGEGGGGGHCTTSAFFGGSTSTVVPAPAAAWLLGTGIVALAGRRLRRRGKAT